MSGSGSVVEPTATAVRDYLRARGLRWTPQRRLLLDVLAGTDGHVTGSELVERCREVDPGTTPSTVYRTLRVLEDHCEHCGASWEISPEDATATVSSFRKRFGFDVDLSHLTVVGRCASCRDAELG
jgi:Fur family ferric uptake transcriptional regulator